MADHLTTIAHRVIASLRILGLRPPSLAVVRTILESVYLASLRTEETRFVRGSVTFADPSSPDVSPPVTTRAQYPKFTRFTTRRSLTVELIGRLSRAVDQWSGSIAIYGTTTTNLVVWGVIDQLVHSNVILHREPGSGMGNPGIFTVAVDAIGSLSVYHRSVFLAGLRHDRVFLSEPDALHSEFIHSRISPVLLPSARRIGAVLGKPEASAQAHALLFDNWAAVVARLCIGLRRLGTGGAFLISPAPLRPHLDVSNRFTYQRMCDALVLSVLDSMYAHHLGEEVLNTAGPTIAKELVTECDLAETDSEDREHELTGAVRLVTTLAAIDGVVLLTPSLSVLGFGAKIKSEREVGHLYDAIDFIRYGTAARTIDASRFGTRHGSMFRYCRDDRRAIGVIVSQDGQVRLTMSSGRSLILWENVRLLGYDANLRSYAAHLRRARRFRFSNRDPRQLGYTDTPKTISALARIRRSSSRSRRRLRRRKQS
jgi:hypothetical protein